MTGSTVLLLGDITGKSRIGVRMMTAVLEACGHDVLALPTALISNMLKLGKHCQMDTTAYLLDTLDTWAELGIGYDLLCAGYITGSAQAQALCSVMDGAKARGVRTVVDPILGDGGRMYDSVSQDQAQGMRQLCRHADIITPNMTEACLLAGEPCVSAMEEERLFALAERLGEGARSVLITSAVTLQGTHAIVGVDRERGERVFLPYEAVAGRHYGTGDRFTALLIDGLFAGRSLGDAARAAGDGVLEMILRHAHEND